MVDIFFNIYPNFYFNRKVYYFKNSEIGADWQDVPESIYLMYALGKNPSPQFYKLNSRSLNYPGGL